MAQQDLSGVLRSLHEVALELSLEKNPDDLCRRAISWALGNLNFDRASLWFIDGLDPRWSLGSWGTDEAGNLRDERGARVLRDPYIAPAEFYEGIVPVLHYRNQVCYDQNRREVGRADKALAPLWDGNLIIGELAVDNFVSGRAISESDLEPLIILARLVAHDYTLLGTRRELARVSESRGTLLKEIRHRTRNNLNVIAGLVTLESLNAEGEEARQKLGALRDRVDALGSLYHLLDHEAEGSPVSLDAYLRTVASGLALAHGADARGICLQLSLEPVRLDDSRCAPLGIAVNELLTNCLKYGFQGRTSGLLQVILTKRQTDLVLEVRDDGPGLPPDLDLSAASGMGLGLVGALARQVRGHLTCTTNGGAHFTIVLPAR